MDEFDIDDSSGTEVFDEIFMLALPATTALTDEDVVHVNLPIPDAVSELLGLQDGLLDTKDRIVDVERGWHTRSPKE